MRVSIKEWLESNNMKSKNGSQYVMCVDDGYAPHFHYGKFYTIIKSYNGKSIKSKLFRVNSMDSQVINKLFIPIQGEPTNLTLRDKLLIKVRTNVSF